LVKKGGKNGKGIIKRRSERKRHAKKKKRRKRGGEKNARGRRVRIYLEGFCVK